MLTRVKLIIDITLLVVILIIVGNWQQTYAQCAGSYTSSPVWGCGFDPIYATYYCDPGGSINESCVWYSDPFGPGTSGCYAGIYTPESCSVIIGGCVIQNRWDGLTSSGCGGGPVPTSPPPTPVPTSPPPTPVPTPIPTPIPTPVPISCDITAYDLTLNGTGDTALSAPITVNSISPAIYSINQILFSVNPPPVAGITANPLYPNPDTTAAYQVEMEGLAIGTTTYTATATLNDPGATQCLDTADITVSNPTSWWQVKEGDAVSDAAISSATPNSL